MWSKRRYKEQVQKAPPPRYTSTTPRSAPPSTFTRSWGQTLLDISRVSRRFLGRPITSLTHCIFSTHPPPLRICDPLDNYVTFDLLVDRGKAGDALSSSPVPGFHCEYLLFLSLSVFLRFRERSLLPAAPYPWCYRVVVMRLPPWSTGLYHRTGYRPLRGRDAVRWDVVFSGQFSPCCVSILILVSSIS